MKRYRSIGVYDFLHEIDILPDDELKKNFKLTRKRVFKRAGSLASANQLTTMRRNANRHQSGFF